MMNGNCIWTISICFYYCLLFLLSVNVFSDSIQHVLIILDEVNEEVKLDVGFASLILIKTLRRQLNLPFYLYWV